MKIITAHSQELSRARNVFLHLFKKDPLSKAEIFPFIPNALQTRLVAFAKSEFKGDDGEVKWLWTGKGKPERIALSGLGDRAKWHERKSPLLPRRFVQLARKANQSEFAVHLSLPDVQDMKDAARIFATNMIMANYEFNRYKKEAEKESKEIKTATLLLSKATDRKAAEQGIREGLVIGEETNNCRDLVNTPGGDMTPTHLAEAAQKAGKRAGFRVRIMEETEIKKLGMGGVLGVARGSNEKPKFIICEYRGARGKTKPLVLVGKGVTFDTGGLNLKPDEHIYEMHMDMSGGAAVIHGIAALARLKIPVHAVGLIPAVENMPSGSSYRPGDLLKTMSGKTIEVLNTDAEGRVILSDALYYGAVKYRPGFMADFATLTGAAHVALGSYCSAVFTNQEKLTDSLVNIGQKSGDYVWPLPLWDEYLSEIKGTFGDLSNTGKGDRYGGATHGAKFLEQFVKKTPWAHFDIAPRMTATEHESLAKGAAGTGVRYIVELGKNYQTLFRS